VRAKGAHSFAGETIPRDRLGIIRERCDKR
jgi:hypothetical protein